jgi:hypothetical protein
MRRLNAISTRRTDCDRQNLRYSHHGGAKPHSVVVRVTLVTIYNLPPSRLEGGSQCLLLPAASLSQGLWSPYRQSRIAVACQLNHIDEVEMKTLQKSLLFVVFSPSFRRSAFTMPLTTGVPCRRLRRSGGFLLARRPAMLRW